MFPQVSICAQGGISGPMSFSGLKGWVTSRGGYVQWGGDPNVGCSSMGWVCSGVGWYVQGVRIQGLGTYP